MPNPPGWRRAEQPPVRLEIGPEIRQMHVVVAVGQQGVAQWLEHAGLVAAEVVREDQIQRRMGFGLVVIVPLGVVPAAAAGHLLRRQSEQEEVRLAGGLGHLDRGAVARADRERPVHHELVRLVCGPSVGAGRSGMPRHSVRGSWFWRHTDSPRRRGIRRGPCRPQRDDRSQAGPDRGCTSAQDVVAAVNFTREQSLPLSVYGGGHGITGAAVATRASSSTCGA